MTDFWDQRCLRTILRTFFDPKTLDPDYKFSESGMPNVMPVISNLYGCIGILVCAVTHCTLCRIFILV